MLPLLVFDVQDDLAREGIRVGPPVLVINFGNK
jgi:hypothetical protein